MTGPAGPVTVTELLLGTIAWASVAVVIDQVADAELLPLAEDVHLRLAHRGLESVMVAGATADDLDGLIGRLFDRAWGADQVGLLGIGTGGALVLRAASRNRLGGAVSWYPSDETGDLVPPVAGITELLTPWLGIFRGSARTDETSGVPAWVDSLRRKSHTHARVAYYLELEGPTESTGATPAADAALFDAWQRTNEWFDQRLEPTASELELAFRSRIASSR